MAQVIVTASRYSSLHSTAENGSRSLHVTEYVFQNAEGWQLKIKKDSNIILHMQILV